MLQPRHPPTSGRLRPWFALLAALAFVAAGFVATEHHHHELGGPAGHDDAGRSVDCSVCTLAHAPAVSPTTTALPAPVRLLAGLAPAVAPGAPARTSPRQTSPRAPPTA